MIYKNAEVQALKDYIELQKKEIITQISIQRKKQSLTFALGLICGGVFTSVLIWIIL